MKNNTTLIFLILITVINIAFFLFNSKLLLICSLNEKSDSEKIVSHLSILLNEAVNKVGKLSCEISKDEVSQNGGWCSKISGKNSTQHLTDTGLAKYLSKYFTGKCVASFGDGPGVYRELLLQFKEVSCYDAYDGAPFAELTTNNNVKFLDLSVPIYHLQQYDWIISMEVAEHIPAQYEAIFIDNLVRHAKEGIVLSWARLGQGGHSHVNNRPFEYVKQQMESRGFKHDPVDSELIKQNANFGWLKNNLNVYKKQK